MSEGNSTPQPPRSKPAKPYPEFPLTAHPAGYWCKKIRGKIHYFGPWEDPDAALTEYKKQKDALHAGRKPREETEGTTLKQLANKFLNAKKSLLYAGQLTPRSWHDYKTTTDLLVAKFGKSRLVADLDPADFATLRNAMAKKWGPVRLGNTIQRSAVSSSTPLTPGSSTGPSASGRASAGRARRRCDWRRRRRAPSCSRPRR
jgi:hypothetical protein